MSTLSNTDLRHLRTSLKLAELGLNTADPNPRVGCVLACGERVIGQGWHAYAGGPHAEAAALADVSSSDRSELPNATAYVSLEPCPHKGRSPPCTEALIDAGVERVIAAMTDPNPIVLGGGFAALEAAGIKVVKDVLVPEATALNPGYCKKHKFGLPWIRLKMAASLDGRIATSAGESQWLTGTDARRDVQAWRARSSAIVTGSGTIIADNPALTVRDPNLSGEYPHNDKGIRQPLRVVLDRRGRINRDATVFHGEGASQWWRAQPVKPEDAVAEDVVQKTGHWTLEDVLRSLADDGMNEVLIESGSTLAGAFVSAGLIDEFIIYQAPTVLGQDAKPLLHLPLLAKLSERLQLQISDLCQIGNDIRIIAHPVENQ